MRRAARRAAPSLLLAWRIAGAAGLLLGRGDVLRHVLAAATVGSLAPSPAPAATRLVAVGDLHGDVAAFRRVLQVSGLSSDGAHWSGGDATLVQIGDVLDKGDDEAELLALIRSLKAEAAASGGRFVTLLGNHEVLNAAGVARYATRRGRASFGPKRTDAFLPGTDLAREISEWPLAVAFGDTLFIHAALTESVARRLADANDAAARWLRGERRDEWSGVPPGPSFLWPSPLDASPVWSRQLSDPAGLEPSADACRSLEASLAELGVTRLVVGHTPQPAINSACGGRVYRIDVGMSRGVLGGMPQALEIRTERRADGGGAETVLRVLK